MKHMSCVLDHVIIARAITSAVRPRANPLKILSIKGVTHDYLCFG